MFLLADFPLLRRLILQSEWPIVLPLPLPSPLYDLRSSVYVLCPATDGTPARHGIVETSSFVRHLRIPIAR